MPAGQSPGCSPLLIKCGLELRGPQPPLGGALPREGGFSPPSFTRRVCHRAALGSPSVYICSCHHASWAIRWAPQLAGQRQGAPQLAGAWQRDSSCTLFPGNDDGGEGARDPGFISEPQPPSRNSSSSFVPVWSPLPPPRPGRSRGSGLPPGELLLWIYFSSLSLPTPAQIYLVIYSHRC